MGYDLIPPPPPRRDALGRVIIEPRRTPENHGAQKRTSVPNSSKDLRETTLIDRFLEWVIGF